VAARRDEHNPLKLMKHLLIAALLPCTLAAGYYGSLYLIPKFQSTPNSWNSSNSRTFSFEEGAVSASNPHPKETKEQAEYRIRLAQMEWQELQEKKREENEEKRHKETMDAINYSTTWQILNSAPQK